MALGYRSRFNLWLLLWGCLAGVVVFGINMQLRRAAEQERITETIDLAASVSAALLSQPATLQGPEDWAAIVDRLREHAPAIANVIIVEEASESVIASSFGAPSVAQGILDSSEVPRADLDQVAPGYTIVIFGQALGPQPVWDAAIAQALLIVGLLFAASNLAFISITRSLKGIASFAENLTAQTHSSDPVALSRDELGSLAGPLRKVGQELNRSITALALERDRFGEILETLREGAVAINDQRKITLVNSAFMEMFGLRERPMEKPMVEVLRQPEMVAALQTANQEGIAEVEFELPGPRRRVYMARASRLNKVNGMLIIFYDLTELRELQKNQRAFVANASHELRTPVTSISGAAETLLNGAMEDPASRSRFLESLVRNADRLTNLISDLLDLSRIENRENRLNIEEVNVAESVDIALSTVAAQAEEKAIGLRFEVPEDLNVSADEPGLDRILNNLVENAVKYTPEGGTMVVRAYTEGSDVLIEVEDTGRGIPARDRERIFERFYRVQGSGVPETKGTGLGLAISRELVHRMGGEIGVRPAPERGSIFWIRLSRYEDFVPSALFVSEG